jgi:crotonobetainyl-CoA:carnitine CoA-transferase CaiB-like acyl-CoA transferase
MTEPGDVIGKIPHAEPAGPLKGLVILDLTQMLAGPYCTMVLGDLGARVIKVESPAGDHSRPFARLPGDDDPRSFGGYFQSINRNKDSVVIDLKSDAGRDIVRRLAAKADVVVENFRAGVIDGLGLSYESLAAINPRLVYGTLRGFGDARTGESPYLDWPAFDVVAQAMGGFMGITGQKGGHPQKSGPGIGDIVPGIFLSVGILAAVLNARETGRGQFVDVAMYDGVLALCERVVFQHSYLGENPGPEGAGHPLFAPFGIFPAKDGFVTVACPTNKFWRILAAEMGRPELGEDARFATEMARAANRSDVDALVGEWTGARTKAELSARLGGKLPFGPVNRIVDIVADPHVAARNMLATVMQPGPAARPVRIANTPIHMSKTQGGVRARAPMLGEDSERVLAEFGYSDDEIAALRAAGAIA